MLPAAASRSSPSTSGWPLCRATSRGASGPIRNSPASTSSPLKDGEAEITSAGGINIKMKPTKPNVYEGDFQLGGLNLHFVADLAATPRTLNVSEKNLGCKWTAKKE